MVSLNCGGGTVTPGARDGVSKSIDWYSTTISVAGTTGGGFEGLKKVTLHYICYKEDDIFCYTFVSKEISLSF